MCLTFTFHFNRQINADDKISVPGTISLVLSYKLNNSGIKGENIKDPKGTCVTQQASFKQRLTC